ncbi:Protein of unknown function [Cnuella takakiae]|uniref:DUF3575 domain-containing protein n=1 Tax=Cnuella takakiae TaxID=1302690 RepID=A0A1M4YJJ6_9BACT|nr:DUF3575 domain-containing protein [Cnuella takakiae]OLY93165.1 hypothetical protein BUE76_15665 [Cnuella takakiae]SHF05662.1 Protein of unknown function [Cnuella takakiae]
MTSFKSIMAALLLTATAGLSTQAQSNSEANLQSPPRNIVKFNLAGLAARNYQLQYERVLSRRISLALSYRTMPKGSVPFKSKLLNLVDDQNFTDAVTNLEISGTALTPEVRIYLGKGYGQGFYIAPFYRNASFDATGAKISFETLPGKEESISLAGKTKTNSGGILFGAQWGLGKHVSLDWWILGPHIGTGKADLVGVPSKTLTAYEQERLRQELDNMDFPLKNVSYTVGPNRTDVKLDGTLGGVRAGLSLGVRF